MDDAVERFDGTVSGPGTLLIVRMARGEVAREWVRVPTLELHGSSITTSLREALVTGGRRWIRRIRYLRELALDELAVFEDLGFASDRVGWVGFDCLEVERVTFRAGEEVTLLGVPTYGGHGTYREQARRVAHLDVRVFRGEARDVDHWDRLRIGETPLHRSFAFELGYSIGWLVRAVGRLLLRLLPTMAYGLLVLFVLRWIGGG